MTELDRSLLTGESLPLRVGTGDKVHAGEVNLTGPLTLRVTAAGRDTALGRMADLVALAETTRNKYTSLADRAARAYSPLVHLLSFSAFGVWMYLTGGDWRFAINISAAVLIITCPCALGLAVPAVVTAASGKLYRKGLLIKSATALERLAKVDTVVFDKTGTLTLGTPVPVGLEALSEADRALALGLAEGSAHPLAKGLVVALRALGTTPAVLTDLREVPGHGIEARLGKTRVRLGRAEWVGAAPGDLTATWLSRGGAAPLEIPFTDSLRPGAEALVARLKADGFAVHLISGDTMGAVADIAARLGIDSWQDSALPEAKAAFIRDLTSQGRQVLMVGDGLNDTVALTEAAVSISPASALDAARVASDMVLTGQGLEPVADALRISKQAVRRIKENFGISAAYNIVAVPVALIGLATPLMAAAAMSLSSITVTLNALRMK
jgi:Cu2+-exporting ATPase